ncbi:hypothetical protein JTE90_029359 [Oedothorax gibbosus]|uniref:Uncharacterized protein n=1 Tax=Oedothorax gibbosus TaxID=931172 RepID=A0AAV6TK07_9ARAC|nr:hypothetical protein JTE90_029359 [Oedothorax gibbosus]
MWPPKSQWGNTVRVSLPLCGKSILRVACSKDIAEKIRAAGFTNVEVENACPPGSCGFEATDWVLKKVIV